LVNVGVGAGCGAIRTGKVGGSWYCLMERDGRES
jgi:hypothetical protein